MILSPSQVKTFLDCERKWGAKYLDKLPDEGSDSADFGKKVHAMLASYLETGVLPAGDSKEDETALAMIQQLPLPELGQYIERPFSFEHEGVQWRGIKDLTYVDAERADPPVPVLHDHKTTSNLKWAKTAEELENDPQKIIYALDEFHSLGAGVDALRADWLYGDKEGRTRLVSVMVDRQETIEAMKPLTTVGKRILAIYEAHPPFNDLPPTGLDEGMCYAYGRCPFLGVCDLTPTQRVRSLMRNHSIKEERMNLKERMAARKAAQTETTEVPPAPAMTLAEKVGASISPPPFAPYKVIGLASEVEVIDTTAEVSPETPKKLGRPKGAKNKAKEESPLPETVEPAHTLFTLLINTYPEGSPYTLFAAYVAPVLAAVRETTGVEDYRLVDYGKGAGVYATALEQYLASNPPVGHLVVDARTQEGRDALPTLERAAGTGNILRGF